MIATEKARRRAERYARRWASEICIVCGEEDAAPDRRMVRGEAGRVGVRCQECAARRAARAARLRSGYRKLGLCWCGRATAEGRRTCPACLAYRIGQQARDRARRAA